MGKKLFYGLLALAFGLGFLWLALSYSGLVGDEAVKCTFKQLTGIPCASCGTTRSVKLVFAGEFGAALTMNPIGVLCAFAMVVLPFWVAYDLTGNRQTLFELYKKAEAKWPLRWIAAALGGVLLLNWIWNIHKGI